MSGLSASLSSRGCASEIQLGFDWMLNLLRALWQGQLSQSLLLPDLMFHTRVLSRHSHSLHGVLIPKLAHSKQVKWLEITLVRTRCLDLLRQVWVIDSGVRLATILRWWDKDLPEASLVPIRWLIVEHTVSQTNIERSLRPLLLRHSELGSVLLINLLLNCHWLCRGCKAGDNSLFIVVS